jgi:hypothetical protein
MSAAFDPGTVVLSVGPGEERENPSTGADRASAEEERSGRALQPFLDAGSGHDVVAVAEAEGCL